MSNSKTVFVKPNEKEIKSIVSELLPREVIKGLVRASGVSLYWRLLTPLVVVWCFIYQRLSSDHTCDEVVSHLHDGGADDLDSQEQDKAPLSQRLRSESTSGYVQGRNRLPLSVLEGVLRHVYEVILRWLHEGKRCWKGHAVRWMDGTTMRTRPFGDLEETYGQAQNQHGVCYWVVVRVLAAFCLHSEAIVAAEEAAPSISESAMTYQVMAQDPEPNSIYVADQGLGVYRTVQSAKSLNHEVVLRVKKSTAKRLWKTSSSKTPLISGSEHFVTFEPEAYTKLDPNLPCEPIKGRLIYLRIERDGFRPMDVYLFTTLLDVIEYPLQDICELYSLRWQVEIDLRQIKTTLEMEQFEVKSADLFRKELVAGLLTYNLIRAFMVKTAINAGIKLSKLSFSQCWRRTRKVFVGDVPDWVVAQGDVLGYLLTRLAKCILPHQPNKVKHEPRKVRRKPAPFPQLRGSRDDARKEVLHALVA